MTENAIHSTRVPVRRVHARKSSTRIASVQNVISPGKRVRRPSARNFRPTALVAIFALCLSLFGTVTASTASAKALKISKATFAREITDKFEAKGVTTEFLAEETVYLLLKINGRPKKGKIEGVWSFRGGEIGRANVDLATINKGVLFSFGEDTYVKFFFKPGPDGLVIGSTYAVDVNADGVAAGRYSFKVVPPKGALPSKVLSTRLAKAEGGTVTKVFARTDTVFLLFNGDFGIKSWVEANWTVNGKAAPEGTRSLTLKEDVKAVDGNFSFLPKGGWPKGSHSVMLVLNDVTVGKYAFTVA